MEPGAVDLRECDATPVAATAGDSGLHAGRLPANAAAGQVAALAVVGRVTVADADKARRDTGEGGWAASVAEASVKLGMVR